MGLDAVEFLLSSRRILRCYLVGDIVDWSLEEGGSFQKMPRIYTDEVRLMAKDKFVADSRPYERLEPLKQIPGLFLGAAQTFVVLEVRGCPGVSFSEMALPDGKSVIFVDGD